MHLLGQGRSAARRVLTQDAGFVMAALLVMLNIMAILMTVAVPVWKTAVKREREAELVWRGTQYARAVNLFRMKYANAYPPNLDILLKERFLRKKYKDPMTKDGEFQLVFAAQQQQRPGTGAVSGAAGQITPAAPPPAPIPLDQTSQGPAGAAGGIMGVASKSTDASLKLFNGRAKYNEWVFTPQTVLGNRAAGAAGQAGAPGAPGAGGGPGSQRPGTTMPGTARPGMPTTKPGMPRPPG
jgi:type II secretory pathway pseudopilin PulG